jgi:hypothetical protein
MCFACCARAIRLTTPSFCCARHSLCTRPQFISARLGPTQSATSADAPSSSSSAGNPFAAFDQAYAAADAEDAALYGESTRDASVEVMSQPRHLERRDAFLQHVQAGDLDMGAVWQMSG